VESESDDYAQVDRKIKAVAYLAISRTVSHPGMNVLIQARQRFLKTRSDHSASIMITANMKETPRAFT